MSASVPQHTGFASTEWFRVVDAARFRDAMDPYAVTVWSELDAHGVERFALSCDGDWPDLSEDPVVDLEIGFPLLVSPHLPPGEIAAFHAVFRELQPAGPPRVSGYCMVMDSHGLRAGSRLDEALTRVVLGARHEAPRKDEFLPA